MKRVLSLIGVVVLLLAAAGLWWWRPSTPPAPPASPASPAPPAPALSLGIDILSAGDGDGVVVTVHVFDRRSRQAEAIQRATGGQWRGRGLTPPATPAAPPPGWTEQVRLQREDGQPIPVTTRRGSGEEVVLVVSPTDAPPAGARLRAVLTLPTGEVTSGLLTREGAPSDPVRLEVARARMAQAQARWDVVTSIADALTRSQPASPWGHYLRGLAYDADGDREAARAAFQRALDRITPGEEPPIGLILR